MTKKNKLFERFLKQPKDFTYNELKTMLRGFGYDEFHSGKTSGSRVSFFNKAIGHEFKIHKPHPENLIKSYLMKFILQEIKDKII